MKKISIVIVALIILILAVALIVRQKNKEPVFVFDPADSGIYYEDGALHEEWGKYTLEILKGGKSTFNRYQNLELKKSYSFETSGAELAKILDVAGQNSFLSLNDEYVDPAIMDGGKETITIFYGNNSKTVTVINDYVREFGLVVAEINKLIYKKIEEDPFK